MAEEALSDRESLCIVRDRRCVVHGTTEAETAQAARAEIKALRNRIAELEAALARLRPSPDAKVVALPLAPDEAALARLRPSPDAKVVALPVAPDKAARIPDALVVAVPVTPDKAARIPDALVVALPVTPDKTAPTPDPAVPHEPVEATESSEPWTDADATFEERLAARAFFDHGSDDEPARRWILDDG